MSRNQQSPPAENRHNRIQLLRRLWQYLGRNRRLIVLAVLLSAAASLLSLYGPKLSGRAINSITSGEGVDIPFVLHCAGWMAACYLLSSVFSYLLQFVMIRLSRAVARQMRKDIFDNLTRLPVSFFDTRQVGDIVSVITYDVDTVNQSLSSDALQVINVVEDMYTRKPLADYGSITLHDRDSSTLAFPYGAEKDLTISGTNTLGVGNVLVWNSSIDLTEDGVRYDTAEMGDDVVYTHTAGTSHSHTLAAMGSDAANSSMNTRWMGVRGQWGVEFTIRFIRPFIMPADYTFDGTPYMP